MAPVSATGTGVPRQRIDDPDLRSLLARLARFDPRVAGTSPSAPSAGGRDGSAAGDGAQERKSPPLDVDGLVAELGAVGKWRFQEQVSRPCRTPAIFGPAWEFTAPVKFALFANHTDICNTTL